MNLFESHSEILPQVKHFGENADNMLDFLEMKLAEKGFGRISKIATCNADTGTHETPIFSGEFECVNGGWVKVKCVHRKCKNKKAHWAVYITNYYHT